MASYASSSPSSGSSGYYNPSLFGATALSASNQALNDLANRYSNNSTIGNLAVGRLIDNASTLGNIGISDLYNRSMLSTLGEYQRALDQGRKGDTLQIMAAEGGIARDLYNVQFAGQERLVRATGEQQRMLADTQGGWDLRKISATGEQARMLADTQGGWDLRKIGAQGVEDRRNIAATGIEQRALEVTRGEQERTSMKQGTIEELRRRADAREQASRYGGRFYS